MTDSNSIERWRTAYQDNAGKLTGAQLPWLTQARDAALENFMASGFPTRRDEEWKYTGIAPIEK